MCHPREQDTEKQEKNPPPTITVDTIKPTPSPTNTSSDQPVEPSLDTSTELINIYRSNKGRPIRSNLPTADFAAPPGFNKTEPPIKPKRKIQKPPTTNFRIRRLAPQASIHPSLTGPNNQPGQMQPLHLPTGTRTHPIDITTSAYCTTIPPQMSHIPPQPQASIQRPHPRTLPPLTTTTTTQPRLGSSYASLPHRFGGLALARGRKLASSSSSQLTWHEYLLVKELDIWRRRHYRRWNWYGKLEGEEDGEGETGPKLRPILGRGEGEGGEEFAGWGEGLEGRGENVGLPGLRAALEEGERGRNVEEGLM